MKTSSFTLLRHGQVDGAPALYGHTDVALSSQGRSNINNAIEKIHTQLNINSITSSPLIRCVESAEKFSALHKIPLQLEANFKEMHFGDWDGIAFDDMAAAWPQLETFWRSPNSTQPPNGETLQNFAERVIDAWELLATNNTGQHQLIICHGGVIRIILAHILNIDWRKASLYQQLHIDYASSCRIDIGSYEGALPVVKWIGQQ